MCQQLGVGYTVGHRHQCPAPGWLLPSLRFSALILVGKHITKAYPLQVQRKLSGGGEAEAVWTRASSQCQLMRQEEGNGVWGMETCLKPLMAENQIIVEKLSFTTFLSQAVIK